LTAALRQPEYVHVLINHLPVTGLLVAVLVLAIGALLRQRAVVLLGLALVAVFAATVLPVVYFGEQGFDRVLAMTYEEGGQWLRRHHDLAQRWKYLYYATAAIVAAISFIVSLLRPKTLWVAVPLTLILAIGCLVAGAAISEAGGKVRHTEFRTALHTGASKLVRT